MTSKSKILLVTGKRAESLVGDYSSKTDVETEVEVLPISIASFMSSSLLLREIEERDLEDFKMILTPGLVKFDLNEVEDELGIPVFKGPQHAADIPIVLENLDEIELSKEKPASELLEKGVLGGVKERIQEIETRAESNLDETSNFRIGKERESVLVGKDFPPRIVGEIADAPKLSNEEIIEIAGRYIEGGAEIIDIGMVAEKEMSQEIPRIISTLQENFNIPLSIDTTDSIEIRTAVENEIDLIVSIDGSTIDEFEGLDIPAVIIPRNPDEEFYPREPGKKVEYLEKLLTQAEELGYRRPIADPILEPVGRGCTDSLVAFYNLRKSRVELPLFMGIGNVIELFDADSIGMTALLLGVASEINVDFVLSVEASDKTQGNISEIRRARDMMVLASERNTVPKDLAINLLEYKEKRKLFDPYDEEIEKEAEVVQSSGKGEFPRDSKGFFKIFAKDSDIVAVFYGPGGPKTIIKGNSAADVSKEIVDRELVSELSHAAYLGRELQKSEIAIRTNRGYIQEDEVF